MEVPQRGSVTVSTLRTLLALSALICVLAVGLVALGLWQAARADAARNAERVSEQIVSRVVGPLSGYDHRRTDEAARAELLERMGPYLDSGIVYRVKVWSVSEDGLQIVFSDEPRLVGERKPPNPALVASLAAGDAVVVPVPDDDEHRFEIAEAGDLLEVFTGFTDAGGTFTMLELYVPVGVVEATHESLMAVLPLAAEVLLCLVVGLVSVAVALARRIDRDHVEQREVLRYGLAAAELRSREIAGRLHDDLLPDLASVGLLIDATRGGAEGDLLELARGILTKNVIEIRALLSSVAATLPLTDDPRNLFTELAQRLCGSTHRVQVDIDPRCATVVGADAGLLLHRIAGELLRNVVRHAGGERVRLRLAVEAGQAVALATLTVTDDGAGFDPAARPAEGHVGLLLIRRVLDDVGGDLAVIARPGEGASVTARVPADLRLPGRPAMLAAGGEHRVDEQAGPASAVRLGHRCPPADARCSRELSPASFPATRWMTTILSRRRDGACETRTPTATPARTTPPAPLGTTGSCRRTDRGRRRER